MHTAEDLAPWSLNRDQLGVADGHPHRGIEASTVLSSSLILELQHLRREPYVSEPIEVVAACMRLRESALLHIGLGHRDWSVTLFPERAVFHSSIDLAREPIPGLGAATLHGCEPARVAPPARNVPADAHAHYFSLSSLLWSLALDGPGGQLIRAIDESCWFRAGERASQPLHIGGALGSAIARLHRQAAAATDIARWPGMDQRRANRLLNALYLDGRLMVLRVAAIARRAQQPRSGSGAHHSA